MLIASCIFFAILAIIGFILFKSHSGDVWEDIGYWVGYLSLCLFIMSLCLLVEKNAINNTLDGKYHREYTYKKVNDSTFVKIDSSYVEVKK